MRIATSGCANRSRSVDVPVPAASSKKGCVRNVDWNCFGNEPARTCCCTARSAVVLEAIDRPGFMRTMMFSQAMSSSNAMLGSTIGSVRIGMMTSNGRPTSMPRNAGGVTPTIVIGCRSNVTLAPIAASDPPKRSRHSR